MTAKCQGPLLSLFFVRIGDTLFNYSFIYLTLVYIKSRHGRLDLKNMVIQREARPFLFVIVFPGIHEKM